MKTEIRLEIWKTGELNDSILRMVTNHNKGNVEVSAELIRMRVHCYYAEWATISPIYSMYGDSDRLDISENGKLCLVLTWQLIPEELNETESNLLTQNELS